MENYYTNKELEAMLNMIYNRQPGHKHKRLLDQLPVRVIENTLKRHPEDKVTWVSTGVLHTRSRKGLSASQV